jgi:hypothetical protein
VCGSVETAFHVPYGAACMGCWAHVAVHLAWAHLPCRWLLCIKDMERVWVCVIVWVTKALARRAGRGFAEDEEWIDELVRCD